MSKKLKFCFKSEFGPSSDIFEPVCRRSFIASWWRFLLRKEDFEFFESNNESLDVFFLFLLCQLFCLNGRFPVASELSSLMWFSVISSLLWISIRHETFASKCAVTWKWFWLLLACSCHVFHFADLASGNCKSFHLSSVVFHKQKSDCLLIAFTSRFYRQKHFT